MSAANKIRSCHIAFISFVLLFPDEVLVLVYKMYVCISV